MKCIVIYTNIYTILTPFLPSHPQFCATKGCPHVLTSARAGTNVRNVRECSLPSVSYVIDSNTHCSVVQLQCW